MSVRYEFSTIRWECVNRIYLYRCLDHGAPLTYGTKCLLFVKQLSSYVECS